MSWLVVGWNEPHLLRPFSSNNVFIQFGLYPNLLDIQDTKSMLINISLKVFNILHNFCLLTFKISIQFEYQVSTKLFFKIIITFLLFYVCYDFIQMAQFHWHWVRWLSYCRELFVWWQEKLVAHEAFAVPL